MLGIQSRTIHVFLILFSLALVDCAITIARRVVLARGSVILHSSAVLLVNELLKLSFCLVQVVRSSRKRPGQTLSNYFTNFLRGALQLFPICLLYLLANLVSYAALRRITASVFAAISQLKVLTTAFFAVYILGNKISWRRWRTLTVLTLAVMIISLSSQPKSENTLRRTGYDGALSYPDDYILGVALAFLQTVFTGLACIILEMRLKELERNSEKQCGDVLHDIWDRNIQLSFCSILIYVPLVLVQTDGKMIQDWSTAASLISVLHALGGILVALSIVYTSSIAKTIAVCAGLTLTSLLGGSFGDSPPTVDVSLAGVIVVLMIIGYRDDITLEV